MDTDDFIILLDVCLISKNIRLNIRDINISIVNKDDFYFNFEETIDRFFDFPDNDEIAITIGAINILTDGEEAFIYNDITRKMRINDLKEYVYNILKEVLKK
jgi:hypothetical protein